MRVNVFGIMAAMLLSFQAAPSWAGTFVEVNIPQVLHAVDQDGNAHDFESIKGEKGVVLVFVRSADWCPHCKKQLLDLSAAYKEIAATGYQLVSISYDSVENLKKFDNSHQVPFRMLSDKGSTIIKAFGILNENMKPGSRGYGIPNPAIYIVSSTGDIQAKLAKDGHRVRPSPQEIKEAIQGLSSGS